MQATIPPNALIGSLAWAFKKDWKADLFEEKDCRKIIKLTDENFGKIDSLVNVAGFTERGTILSTTMENYERCFNVNTKAPFILMQDTIKIMLREKIKGTILNILSMAVHSGMLVPLRPENAISLLMYSLIYWISYYEINLVFWLFY